LVSPGSYSMNVTIGVSVWNGIDCWQ
jgi:hypothetical protein